MRKIDDLLQEARDAGASDIHIASERAPYFRIYGALNPVVEEVFTDTEVSDIVEQLIKDNKTAQERLKERFQADFSYNLPDGTRFRVNIFHHDDGLAAALRLIPNRVKGLEELSLPSHILQFAEQKQGFVMCVGPTGEGKSTTLAAMVQHINEYKSVHIITIEDPIEYHFAEDKSIIDQREIGRDTRSFPEAIRATLRQDPDVILIGELRDRESMQTALTLAETGHLVLTTLHTNDAAQTVQRIIDSFPADQQDQIRSQLSLTISGIISQRLLPRVQGGLVPAVEVLMATTAVKSAIREGKIHQIPGMIETGGEFGMQTMKASMDGLVTAGVVAEDEVKAHIDSLA